jgi:uncharacterized protein
MTPEERDLVAELFDRLAALEDAQRDPEAERLIKDGLRQAPNAPYALVQAVLVQDEALKRADARIRELEGSAEPPPRDTSFLGGVRDSLVGRRGSVPSVRAGEAAAGTSPGMSSAWHTTGTPAMPAQGVPPPGYGSPGYGSPPMGQGGSFLGTAAAAAAGMIGGSLLLGGIRSMMGHPSAAHAAVDPTTGSVAPNPWSGGNAAGGELSRQAGLDDIGRAPSAGSGGSGRGYGVLDDKPGGDDVEDDQDSDFDDDSGLDGGDGGGDE